jgi:hypothetical protein
MLHIEGEMRCRMRLFATFYEEKIKKRGETDVLGLKRKIIFYCKL